MSWTEQKQKQKKFKRLKDRNFRGINEIKKLTGSQQEAIVTPNAKTDMQRHGKKYGNLQDKCMFASIMLSQIIKKY